MENFIFHNPTKLYFGAGSIKYLSEEIKSVGHNVLLCYGGGSIKKSGLYDTVIEILKSSGKNIFELSGIMPNPRTDKVYEGIEICRKHKVDFILAVGGGSTIDCAKMISVSAGDDRDFWQAFMIEKQRAKTAVPLATVLTNAATGSEMDHLAVITNWEKNIKNGYGDPLLQPTFSILDPTYTYTLPKSQILYGAIDIISHCMEEYFSAPDTSNLSDDIAESIIKNVVYNLPLALENPENYIARSNLMWDSSMAINSLIASGKKSDWQSHQIEHALSAFYDIPHGAGLAIVHPNYLKYISESAENKLKRFAKNVWNETSALGGIEKMQAFFKEMGSPITLKEVNIPESALSKIAPTVNLVKNNYKPLTHDDVLKILYMSL